MATKNNLNSINKKKVLGILGLIVFSLVFIFSCLSPFLPLGKILVGTFGIMVYPLSMIFAFICMAKFLGFSYKRATKPTVLFILALCSVLFCIHSIATYKALDAVVSFSTMKPYLAFSYSGKATLLGSFGSIFVAMLSMLLGPMGTIVAFVIFATIFIGLFFDYQYYGKYEDTRINNLKKRAIREKVSMSDQNVHDGVPDYSYENNEVFDEVSVDAKSLKTEEYEYETDSYVAQSEPIDELVENFEPDDLAPASPYSSSLSQTTMQTTSSLSGFGDYDNDDRKQFMQATLGGYQSQPNNTQTPTGFDFDDDEPENILNTPANDLTKFGVGSTIDEEDEDIKEIFNQPEEDEVDSFESPFDKFRDFENEKTPTSFGSINRERFVEREVQKPVDYSPKNENTLGNNPYQKINPQPLQNPFNRTGLGAQVGANSGYGQPQRPFESQRPEPQKPVVRVPSKEQNTGVQGGLPGLRYNPPPLSLLQQPKVDTGDYSEEQNRKTFMLENALKSFNIPATVQNIVRGPKITRYELAVPLGISVKKIPMYEPDIQRALAAQTLTIKAPIPGSSYVGVELENDKFTTVYQRELFESDAFQNCKDPLPIAIGKDISGEIIVKSLAKMVHLLIAGSTGSGKSVFIHNIVLSLLYKYSPDDLRLIMIDPKRVEFNCYNGLPHLLTPEVVMGAEKAINALKWAVKEMDRRYELMSKARYNNIEPYNKSDLVKAGQFEKFPYIVIIVDELAELMQVNKKEVDACIQRLTQLARACGIHMVLATQRPSVDIISGVIKNNVPSRVAFSLQSGIDSKTILGTVGAEKLLGQGDMIFYPTGTSVMSRLQASYATPEEIQAVIDYDIKNNAATYDNSVETAINADPVAADDASAVSDGMPPKKDTLDEYFKEAVRIVMQNDGASTSYLQRRFSIGYSRASRIMDQMQQKGFIAAASGSKPRKILITPEQFEEEFGERYDNVDY